MVQYRENNNIFMGNIAFGSEYLPILRNHCIYKSQKKIADKVDKKHEPGVIDGCGVAGQVYDEEGCGRTFFNFVADKVAKDCGLEASDGDSMINNIGYQHLCVVSPKNFHLSCTVVRL